MDNFLDAGEALRDAKRLSSEDQKLVERVFEYLEELQATQAKARLDISNIEEVYASVEMAGVLGTEDPELALAMRTLVVRTLEDSIVLPLTAEPGDKSHGQRRCPIPHDGYLNFVKQLLLRKEAGEPFPTIITFNYDCALDFALTWNNITVDYGLTKHKGGGKNIVNFLKLHGSLNWAVTESDEIVAVSVSDLLALRMPNQRAQTISGVLEASLRPGTDTRHPIVPSEMHFAVSSSLVEHFKGKMTLREVPLIIPPTWNKLAHQQRLQAVWGAASVALRSAEDIFVFGYSLPSSDHFFRHLYALGTLGPTRLKRFWVFDPDKNVEQKFRGLLGPVAAKRYRFFDTTFEDAAANLGFFLK